nr:MAG TPA: hypothetical protein [Bacteriophage sp.]
MTRLATKFLNYSPYQWGCWLRQNGRTGTLPGLGGVPVLIDWRDDLLLRKIKCVW